MNRLAAVLLAAVWFGQSAGPIGPTAEPPIKVGSGSPSGACGDVRLYTDAVTSTLWVCPVASWVQVGASEGGGVPAGSILIVDTGTCPATYSEVSALSGKTLVGTLAAGGNVGSTGGADNITPAGSVAAPVFTGTPFSGIINHTHGVTDPGHNHTQNAHTHIQLSQTATTGSVGSYEHGTADSSSAASDEITPDALTSATTATNIANTTGISTQNPAGGVSSITPAGTNSAPGFTGTQFDNRSAFTRVIFCKKD